MLLSHTRDILTEYPYEPHKALTIDMTFPCCHVGPTLSSNHPPAPNPALLSRYACLYLVVSINPETFSPFSFLRRLREKLSFVKFYPFSDISSSESDFMASEKSGPVTCGSWIRRPENSNMVVLGRSAHGDSTTTRSVIQFFSFNPITTSLSSSPLVTHVLEEVEGDPVSIAVHPTGDDVVCSTTKGGCKLIELYGGESNAKLLAKELQPLQGVGPQNCLAFSVDGSKLATGGEDGHLRILEWPSLRVILDEPKAHKSVRDMDFSLDSEFLVSTSTDGSARIWKTEDGFPLTTLTRNPDEKIQLCRFSKDGTKPFLFCTVQKGDKSVTAVWDISTWNKIGFKRLLKKPASVMSISKDGKYLALASKDGDVCVADVKKMEICHWSKRLHLGTCIETLEFCPSERVVLTTSNEWGAVVTKLNVPADWKEWQIYALLLGLFLVSAVVFYIFMQNSDSFWNFPLGKDQPGAPKLKTLFHDSPSSDDQNNWNPFGPVDM